MANWNDKDCWIPALGLNCERVADVTRMIIDSQKGQPISEVIKFAMQIHTDGIISAAETVAVCFALRRYYERAHFVQSMHNPSTMEELSAGPFHNMIKDLDNRFIDN